MSTKINCLLGANAPLGQTCVECENEPSTIWMRGYATNHADILLCAGCAMQLARKLLEDICEVATKGGRHD